MTPPEKPTPEERTYLFDNPRNVQRVIRGLFVVCAVLLGLDAVIHRHVYQPLEGLFGFYAFYGFIACVVLVVLAKQMRKVLMRDEDYYLTRARERRARIEAANKDAEGGPGHA